MFTRRIALLCLTFGTSLLHGQAAATASRAGILQVGGGVVSGDSGIYDDRFKGGFVFADFDVTRHFGAEVEVRQIDTPYGNQVYERSYEAGARYRLSYGRVDLFGKAMVGRGVFNYPHDAATIAYNLYGAGGGVDLRLTGHVSARAEYEYQHWIHFSPGELSPSVIEVGAVYRF